MFQRIIIVLGIASAIYGGNAAVQAGIDNYREHQCYTVQGGTFYGPIGNPDSTGPNYCFDADKRRVG